MAKHIETRDFDALIRALRETPEIAYPIMGRAMDQSLIVLTGMLRPYPAEPDRMRSGRLNTYVRGQGFFPRAAFAEGQRARRGAYDVGQVRRVSERLGTKWTYQTRPIPDGIEGELGNTASYAQIVQGDLQPPYHAQTGWLRLGDGMEDAEPDIVRIWGDAADEVLEEIANA